MNIEHKPEQTSVAVLPLVVAGLLIVLDQVTKLAVKGFSLFGFQHKGMYLGESFPVMGDFFRITFVENPGMAFGISFGWGKIFLSLFSIIATVALSFYIGRNNVHHKGALAALVLILAGAAGNMIDRVFYGVLYGTDPLFFGKVVDFLDVDFLDVSLLGLHLQRWYVFNIADACVSCGMVLLLIFHKHIPFLAQPEEETSELAAPSTANIAENADNGQK